VFVTVEINIVFGDLLIEKFAEMKSFNYIFSFLMGISVAFMGTSNMRLFV